jgi:cytochrome c oxidase subunit II
MLNKALGLPPPASEHGYMIDHMLEMLQWFMLLLFIGWSVFFLYSLVRFHRSRHPVADYTGVKGHASTHLEIGVVVFEAVLLLGFAFPLWSTRVNEFPTSADTVKVRAVGYQFGWLIHYPGPDGKFGRTAPAFYGTATAQEQAGLDPADPNGKDDMFLTSELILPKGRPAIVEVTSKDVIHNFAIKSMRIAQDAIPGMHIPMWFTPAKTGDWDIICGQLCGAQHANMKATLEVVENEEFVARFETPAAAVEVAGR